MASRSTRKPASEGIAARPAPERIAFGKKLRARVPRAAHGDWSPAAGRFDPIAVLVASGKGRVAQLLPVRYGRMLASPFAFFRGAASIMAADLATTPRTGIPVQLCGDCHLLNFGGYATPERRVVFAINDFDETLPGPWEWDVKRLCTSVVIAARNNGLHARDALDAATSCARSYREHMIAYATTHALDVWYDSIDADDATRWFAAPGSGRRVKRLLAKAAAAGLTEHDFPELATVKRGVARIKDDATRIYHPTTDARFEAHVREAFAAYRGTLADDRRRLLDRFTIHDIAQKVVGIGSVGTWCGIILMMAGREDPLFLQVKEARASVLEQYLGASGYTNHGQRVVMGQRLMQSASDVFLGWTVGPGGRHFYARQLRDMKVKPLLEILDAKTLELYAGLCGWSLALAHARSGDAALVAGYLGPGAAFDKAVVQFAEAYADQNERDYAALEKAVAGGRIEAEPEK